MIAATQINLLSLGLSSVLVLIALFFSYRQKLKLEKEILIGALRAVIQLSLVGLILQYIFGINSPIFTSLILLLMIFNGAWNAAKRGKGIRHVLPISYLSIFCAAAVTLTVLVLSGALHYRAQEIIPVGGMIVGNAMVALGLSYRQMRAEFKEKREEVEAKLSLGAEIRPASLSIIRDAIRTGMQPTIDSAKTVGIVSLPGMMTGLILAGNPPLEAIKFQIMVSFMLMATTSIVSFMASFLSYRCFFNERKQLKAISSDKK